MHSDRKKQSDRHEGEQRLCSCTSLCCSPVHLLLLHTASDLFHTHFQLSHSSPSFPLFLPLPFSFSPDLSFPAHITFLLIFIFHLSPAFPSLVQCLLSFHLLVYFSLPAAANGNHKSFIEDICLFAFFLTNLRWTTTR